MSPARSRRGHPRGDDTAPAPELIDAGFALERETTALIHRALALSHIAHAVELRRIGAMPSSDGTVLLPVLLSLLSADAGELPTEPAASDPFEVHESWILERAGPPGGWITAGRARRESLRVAYRLALREGMLSAVDSTAGLTDALLDRSEELAQVIVPDYTYLQLGQATTFGHYLLAFAAPNLRHLDRYRTAYERINRSPAGVGPVAGSRFSFDRERLARLLGFDAVLVHARDATWQTDPLADAAMAAALSLLTAAQVAQDLEIYASREFGFVTLPANVCRPSAVMPQKRNPYALSVIRALAGRATGRLTGLLSMQRTGSARTDNALFSFAEATEAVEWAARGQALLAVAIRGMAVDAERTREAAEGLDARATDLAEVLAQRAGIDYGSAYRVVARVMAVDEGASRPSDLTELARAAAADELGAPLEIDLSDVTVDLPELVEARRGLGGASQASISEMLESYRDQLRDHRGWLERTRSSAAASESELLAAAESVIAGD